MNYQIYLKDKGSYKFFSGVMYASKGWTLEMVRQHYRDEMKVHWPKDRFAIYEREGRRGEWKRLEYLK